MSTNTLKGFRDFLSTDALSREYLKNKIIGVFEKWGYDPVETPTLESAEIFEGKIGEDETLFYKFKDLGGRDVVMRYDQTVPICRIIGNLNTNLPMPYRRYQIQPAFRAEKPQSGRYREFLQCDADIFGSDSFMADAEVIALSLDIYKKIGFKDARVLINDRELLRDIPYIAIAAIDKIKKIGKEGVIEDMVKKGIEQKQAEDYLNFVLNLQPNDRINFIMKYLKDIGFDESYFSFEPTIARSFSYSTGPIWEVEIDSYKTGSVLGGERFDNLVESISGFKIPGTGFGLGFDRTLEAALQLGLVPSIQTKTEYLVSILDQDIQEYALRVCNVFRKNGRNVEMYPEIVTKIAKVFKYAEKRGIQNVILIGEDEESKNKINIKNIESGDTKVLDFSDNITELI